MSRFIFPTAPPTDSATVANTGNMFISWLNLQDSDGGLVSKYTLTLEPSFWNVVHQVFYAEPTNLIYQIAITIGAYAAAVIDFVTDPNKWLSPLSELYMKLTGVIYSAVPPQYIVVAAFAIMCVTVFAQRPVGGRVRKGQYQRIAAGFVLVGVVALLVSNPFALIREVLNTELALVSAITGSREHGGVPQIISTSGVDLLRTLTWLINYHDILSAECGRAWSQTINMTAANPPCLTPAQAKATDPDWQTLVMALLLVIPPTRWTYRIPGVIYAFCEYVAVAARVMFNEISLCVMYLVACTYVASVSLGRRRPYDPLARCAARSASHFVMFAALLFVVLVVPAAFIEVVHQITVVPLIVQLILVGLCYHFTADALTAITKNREQVYAMFKSRLERSKYWNTLYPGGQPSAVGLMLNKTMSTPTAWLREQQRVLTSAVDRVVNKGISPGGGAAIALAGGADSEALDAATSRVELYEPPPRIISPTDAQPSLPAAQPHSSVNRASDDTVKDQIVAAVRGDNVIAATPQLDPTTLLHGAQNFPAVWFRGGIPQFTAPQILYPTPMLSAATTTAQQPIQQPRTMRLHDEAAALQRRALVNSTDDSAEGFRSYMSTPPRPIAGVDVTQFDLRSVLGSAEWMQRLTHTHNVQQSQGLPTSALSDVDAEPQIMFVSDATGNRVEQIRHGFGDNI